MSIHSALRCCALLASLLAVGCAKEESSDQGATTAAKTTEKVVIYNWTEYIPAAVLEQFTEETGIEVEYATYESNEAMYAKLKLLNGSGYDIVVPSTYYLEKMRNEGLLQPIQKDKLQNYGNLDSTMLNKSYDPNNDYSVPYLWGSTAIAVNTQDIDPSTITQWSDLWKPELSGKLMIMDDVRDIMAVGLTVAGYKDNTTSEEEVQAGYEALKELWPSIKVINSDSPKTPLIQGNASVGVMWNGEAYMAQQEMGSIAFIYPSDGAILWVDSFVIPKGASNVDNAHRFIDFMLRAESAKAAIEELGYAAPNTAAKDLLDDELKNNKIIFPDAEDIARGTIHQDLGESVLLYEKYWEMLKAGR